MDKFLKLLKDLEEDTEYKRLKKQGYFPDPYPVFLDEKELERNLPNLAVRRAQGVVEIRLRALLKESQC